MILSTPKPQVPDAVVQRSPEGAAATEVIGSRRATGAAPLAFVAEGPTDYVTPAHFHEVNQYQVFLRGGARIGRFDVHAGSIHYADAYGAYGPIVGKEGGYAYLTLRPASSVVYHVMPAEAARLKGRRGRVLMADAELDGPRRTGLKELLRQDDGVAAFELTAAPGEAVPQAPPGEGGGYHVLLAGSMTVAGRDYDEEACACIWTDPGEAAPAMTAGPDGAVVAFVAFGRAKAAA